MGWYPSHSAAVRLLTRLWPAIRAKVPAARVQVVGWNARTALITGRDLQEVRRLSHDLDVQARRALATAERNTSDASGRGAQLLGDLRHFVNDSSALHERTDSDRIDPRDFGGVVTHLIEDARAADSSMRQARVFSDAWDEWQRTMNTLEQLDAIVRR